MQHVINIIAPIIKKTNFCKYGIWAKEIVIKIIDILLPEKIKSKSFLFLLKPLQIVAIKKINTTEKSINIKNKLGIEICK